MERISLANDFTPAVYFVTKTSGGIKLGLEKPLGDVTHAADSWNAQFEACTLVFTSMWVTLWWFHLSFIYIPVYGFTNTNGLLWPLTCDPNKHLLDEFLVLVWKSEVLFNTTWCSLFVNTVLCKEKKPLKKNMSLQFSLVSRSVLPRAHHVQFPKTKMMTVRLFKSRCSRTNAWRRRGHACLLHAVKSH